MNVTVVIVGFRNAADIVACIGCLEKSEYRQFEVVICENGGEASFAALTAVLPKSLTDGQQLRCLKAPENLGYAGGVNLGLASAPHADAWWVLNPDTEPQPKALGELVERLGRGDCDAVGGVIYLQNGRVQSLGGRWRPLMARAVSIGRDDPISHKIVPAAVESQLSYLSGACALVSRNFLEVVGPMREDYFLYCEEVEWFLRGRSRGMVLGFASKARVMHHAGSTTGSNDRSKTQPRTPVYLDERNKILVTRDCFPFLMPFAAPAALILLLLRFGRRRAWRQLVIALQGWCAGLLNRRGPPSWIDTQAG